MDASSPPVSRRSSSSNMPSLIIRLKLPPRALAMATNSNPSDSLSVHHQDRKPMSSPFPPSSPPTVASSPVPSAVQPTTKKGRGQGKRKGGAGLGAAILSLNGEGPGANGGSGAGTPVPVEKEKAKPGPKTNPGNVNAGLRALDRSGRPTRKWGRVEYPVRTCAGYTFHTTVWTTPEVRTTASAANANGNGENGTKVKGEENWNGESQMDKPLEQDVPMLEASAIAVQ